MMKKGRTTGTYQLVAGASSDPVPQISDHATISGTIDGKTLSMSVDACHAGSFVSMLYDGVELLDPSAKGRGLQYAHNILRTGQNVSTNEWSPTEQGTQYDGQSDATGSSNLEYISRSTDGTRLVRRSMPAYWEKPNQITAQSRPGQNDRLVSEMENTIDTQIGWGGDQHVISMLTDVVVPDTTYVRGCQILDCVCASLYATENVFSVLEYLNPSTGATSAYPGYPASSQTQIVMVSSADASIAMAVYQPLGEWGATGYAQSYTAGSHNIFIRAREVVANIVPGKRLYNNFVVLASRAQCITSVMTLDAANITRSTPIALPGLAA